MLREKPLHAALKLWRAEDGDRYEVPVGGFVIDVVRDELLIEVQTSGFSSMKRKLTTLLAEDHRVRILYLIPVQKWIVRVGHGGEIVGRRRSPKRGSVLDIFRELVSFPELVAHPNLEIHVVLTQEEEYRRHDPNKAWRRKGWVVHERRLLSVDDVVEIRGTSDLLALLPSFLPDTFTTADLAGAISCPLRLAQQVAYCLRHAGVIDAVGKTGNSIEYRRIPRQAE